MQDDTTVSERDMRTLQARCEKVGGKCHLCRHASPNAGDDDPVCIRRWKQAEPYANTCLRVSGIDFPWRLTKKRLPKFVDCVYFHSMEKNREELGAEAFEEAKRAYRRLLQKRDSSAFPAAFWRHLQKLIQENRR